MGRLARMVKDARNERGFTQVELAERTDKSKSWIVDIERGKTLPADMETIVALAEALGRDPKKFWEVIYEDRNEAEARTLPDGIVDEMGDWMLAESQPGREEKDEITRAAPRSYQDCAEHAEQAVQAVCEGAVQTGSSIPVVKALTYQTDDLKEAVEFPKGVELRVDTFADEPEEGRTHYREDEQAVVVELRNDVWRRAQEGEGRSRFTAAHELGHALLHTDLLIENEGDFFREFLRTASEKLPDDVAIYESPDYQANSWAGAFLLPVEGVRAYLARKDAADEETSIEQIARDFEVSVQAARIRIEKMLPKLVDFGDGGLNDD